MSLDKGIKYGLIGGLCFFTTVLVTDLASDKFNLVDHFGTNTENVYRGLFLASLTIGGITGGGLRAAVKNASDRRKKPSVSAAVPA
ncbi:MAG: hypothetical protein AAF549_03155 [Pseudomonadota bacterium]